MELQQKREITVKVAADQFLTIFLQKHVNTDTGWLISRVNSPVCSPCTGTDSNLMVNTWRTDTRTFLSVHSQLRWPCSLTGAAPFFVVRAASWLKSLFYLEKKRCELQLLLNEWSSKVTTTDTCHRIWPKVPSCRLTLFPFICLYCLLFVVISFSDELGFQKLSS